MLKREAHCKRHFGGGKRGGSVFYSWISIDGRSLRAAQGSQSCTYQKGYISWFVMGRQRNKEIREINVERFSDCDG
jgi:hypothetical protein